MGRTVAGEPMVSHPYVLFTLHPAWVLMLFQKGTAVFIGGTR